MPSAITGRAVRHVLAYKARVTPTCLGCFSLPGLRKPRSPAPIFPARLPGVRRKGTPSYSTRRQIPLFAKVNPSDEMCAIAQTSTLPDRRPAAAAPLNDTQDHAVPWRCRANSDCWGKADEQWRGATNPAYLRVALFLNKIKSCATRSFMASHRFLSLPNSATRPPHGCHTRRPSRHQSTGLSFPQG